MAIKDEIPYTFLFQSREQLLSVPSTFLIKSKEVTPHMRSILADWLLQVQVIACSIHGLRKASHISMQYYENQLPRFYKDSDSQIGNDLVVPSNNVTSNACAPLRKNIPMNQFH